MAGRRGVGGKDMIWTMIIVLAVVSLMALYSGGFSFSPGSPSADESALPTANVEAGFQHAGGTMDFPVIIPWQVPDSWHPNSFTAVGPTDPGGLPTVRGGWITPDGSYIELVESSGSPERLLAAEFGTAAPSGGTVEAGGATWSVTTGMRSEAAWYRTDGATTLLVTGDASEQDFIVLATAVAP